MFAEILAVVLLGAMFLQKWHYAKREKDLLNRLMAKDWKEYQSGSLQTPPPKGRSTVQFNKFDEKEGGD